MSIRINGAEYETTANKITTERGDFKGLYTTDQYNVSNAETIGTYYLADNPALFEPQRANNFKLLIHGLDGLRRAGVEDDNTSKRATFDAAEDIVTVAVEQCFIPSYSVNPITISRGNGQIKYAGRPQFSTGNLTIVDYLGAELADIFLAWQNKVYNVRTQKTGLAGDYKKTAELIEYTPDMQPVHIWKIVGLWPSNVTFGNLNYNSAESIKITVTCQYDHAYIDVSDLDGDTVEE